MEYKDSPLYVVPAKFAQTIERENAALRADAERYRWLNKQHNFMMYIESEPETRTNLRLRCGEPLDKWLDSRIAEDAARTPLQAPKG